MRYQSVISVSKAPTLGWVTKRSSLARPRNVAVSHSSQNLSVGKCALNFLNNLRQLNMYLILSHKHRYTYTLDIFLILLTIFQSLPTCRICSFDKDGYGWRQRLAPHYVYLPSTTWLTAGHRRSTKNSWLVSLLHAYKA